MCCLLKSNYTEYVRPLSPCPVLQITMLQPVELTTPSESEGLRGCSRSGRWKPSLMLGGRELNRPSSTRSPSGRRQRHSSSSRGRLSIWFPRRSNRHRLVSSPTCDGMMDRLLWSNNRDWSVLQWNNSSGRASIYMNGRGHNAGVHMHAFHILYILCSHIMSCLNNHWMRRVLTLLLETVRCCSLFRLWISQGMTVRKLWLRSRQYNRVQKNSWEGIVEMWLWLRCSCSNDSKTPMCTGM